MERQKGGSSKEERQKIITKLIKESEISTQEELAQLLEEKGFRVTQATISRDIRELNLVKVVNENGKSIYKVEKKPEKYYMSHKFSSVFLASVREIHCVNNFISIRCDTGMAALVCTILDGLQWKEILGTVAGNDTIFIMTKDAESANFIVQQFKDVL